MVKEDELLQLKVLSLKPYPKSGQRFLWHFMRCTGDVSASATVEVGSKFSTSFTLFDSRSTSEEGVLSRGVSIFQTFIISFSHWLQKYSFDFYKVSSDFSVKYMRFGKVLYRL